VNAPILFLFQEILSVLNFYGMDRTLMQDNFSLLNPEGQEYFLAGPSVLQAGNHAYPHQQETLLLEELRTGVKTSTDAQALTGTEEQIGA